MIRQHTMLAVGTGYSSKLCSKKLRWAPTIEGWWSSSLLGNSQGSLYKPQSILVLLQVAKEKSISTHTLQRHREL